MKKFISILFLMSFCFIAMAQTVTLQSMEAYRTGGTYQLVNTDYNLDTTTARTFIFTAPQAQPTTQDYVVNIDSVFGNQTNVAVALYGQKSTIAVDWTQIGSTVNWLGTTSDTTIIISNATANRFRNYKAVITGTGNGRSKIDAQELKLFKE
ncbi:MAG TPA: hypothetical protein VIK86_05585 [Candidatus Paceibacterota bacterium]